MPLQRSRTPRRAAATLLATLPFALVAHPLAAQGYPVVQATPPPAQGELSRALQRLARSPSDFDALVAAGRASLQLDDIDAAIGFFGRADVIRPGDPQVKAGLAGANLRSGRPIEAIALYEQALAAGALPATIAADRGLAYDLVGDNITAQAQYRLALTQARDDETLRRLGLSQAIAGDATGFEATLLPMLQRRDLAAYRARAFGLAILGKEQDAVAIAEAVMPRGMASRMSPYLRYMPKLTRAQQAAAANLGSFPRAAQIGRDDPRFAQYSGAQTAAPAATGDARLAPAGQPLGPRQASSRTSRRQSVAEQRQASAPPPPPPASTRSNRVRERQAAAEGVRTERPVRTGLIERAARLRAAAPPPPPPPPSRSVTPQVQAVPAPTVQPVRTGPATAAAQAPATVRQGELPPTQAAPRPIVVAELPASSAAPGFALQNSGSAVSTPNSAPASSAAVTPPVKIVQVPVPVAATAVEDASVADAFADLTTAPAVRAPAAGAVDITAIKPKLELPPPPPPKAAPPPPPPPPKPKVPSRVWVQVATGKDLKALAFDWRKFGKKAPELLGKRSAYTAEWGQTRRLVTGPVDSAKSANQLVADLKKAGIDAFVFTSKAGEDVAPLN